MVKDPVTGQLKIISPKGWAICDGTNQTPDLKGRFTRGAINPDQAGILGGVDPLNPVRPLDVSYDAGRKGSDFHWGETPWANGPNPVYNLSVKPVNILPPYVDVIYLIKQ